MLLLDQVCLRAFFLFFFFDLMIPFPCSFLINNSYILKTSREALHIEMVSIKRTDKVDKDNIITGLFYLAAVRRS